MYQPNFNLTPKILNGISEIAEIKSVVERSKVLPLNEAQLKRQAIVRMAHTSTSIEGNKLAEFQVDKVLSGMSVAADPKSILEVKNYQLALQEVDKLTSKAQPITMDWVFSLHRILMKGLLPDDKVGQVRYGDIYIVDDLGDGREKLRFEGPPAKKVRFLINELLTWLASNEAKQLHPIIKAGVLHVQFVTIHPFSDGNGRLSRLLTTLILYKEAWDFRKIIVLEDYYNKDRLSYYNALNAVQGKKYQEGSDLTCWLEYFVQGFLVEARKVAESIAAIGFGKVSLVGEPVFLDKDEIKIMDFLSTTGVLTSADVCEVLKIAKRTAQLKLKNLVAKGLIKMEGAGPATRYLIAQ